MKIAMSQSMDEVKVLANKAGRLRSPKSQAKLLAELLEKLAETKDLIKYAKMMEDILKVPIEDLADIIGLISEEIGEKLSNRISGIEIQSTWVKARSTLDKDAIVQFVRERLGKTKIQAEAYVQEHLSKQSEAPEGKIIQLGPDDVEYWRRTSFIRR